MDGQDLEEFEESLPDEDAIDIGGIDLDGDEGDFEDADAWHADLEDALLEGFVDHSMIKSLCQSRVLPAKHRTAVWKICFNTASRGDPLGCWDGKLDLPEQDTIHQACVDSAAKIESERSETIISDMESIVTFYMKSRAIKFEIQWLDLLQPLSSFGDLNRADIYNCFYAILTRYVPKDDTSDAPYDLFRHILMYHDPELCCLLDSKKISMRDFMQPWLVTMFASRCKKEVTLSLWDIYFQETDPYFGIFLALVVTVNAKEQIISMKNDTKEEILKTLTEFPSALEVVDVEDFCQLAIYFRNKTPRSAFRRYQTSFFGGMLLNSSKGADKKESELAQSLCLQVSTEDIFHLEDSNLDFESEPNEVRFFLVDCRPSDFYNEGHLQSAHHLDATLMLREPKEFSMAIESLFVAQKQAIEAGNLEVGEHMCLIGSGDKDEDQHLHMTIAYLLKNQHSYVSVLQGGFDAIVTYLTEANVKLGDWLTGNVRRVRELKENRNNARLSDEPDGPSSGSEKGVMDGFMRSLTTTIKSKSQDIKSKVSKLMESEQGMMDWNSAKPYRGTQPIFSIGGEEEQGRGGSDSDQPGTSKDGNEDGQVELKTLEEWKSVYGIAKVYPCFLVLASGKRPEVCIAIRGDELICLRESKRHKKHAIVSAHPLSTVSKITSKKSCSEMIAFRFQLDGENETAERYLIPDAGVVMKQIKREIMRVLEEKDE